MRTRAALGLRLVKGRSPSLTKSRRNAKLKFAAQNCVVEGAQRRGRRLQSRDTQKVFETRTSTFDEKKADDKVRAQSPSMVHETKYFVSKFENARKSLQS